LAIVFLPEKTTVNHTGQFSLLIFFLYSRHPDNKLPRPLLVLFLFPPSNVQLNPSYTEARTVHSKDRKADKTFQMGEKIQTSKQTGGQQNMQFLFVSFTRQEPAYWQRGDRQ
jgi:hypothetical protein